MAPLHNFLKRLLHLNFLKRPLHFNFDKKSSTWPLHFNFFKYRSTSIVKKTSPLFLRIEVLKITTFYQFNVIVNQLTEEEFERKEMSTVIVHTDDSVSLSLFQYFFEQS